MIAVRIATLVAVMAVSCVGPGLFVLRRVRWNPLQKLCAAVALSLFLLYCVATVTYLCHLPAPLMGWATTLACAALTLLAAPDLRRTLAAPAVRRAVRAYSFVLLFTFVATLAIRSRSGANWAVDWLEHFLRADFFLERPDPMQSILGLYLLPARPPMMNLLAAHFMGQLGDRFEVFETVCIVLNTLPALPLVLLLRHLGRRGSRGACVLAALLVCSPVFVQNATYTWTRGLTTFYVLLAVALYVAAWRKARPGLMTAAFATIAAGTLVHYSTGPYLVTMAAHYTFAVLRRRPPARRLREFLAVSATGAAVLATWFAWSIAVYGLRVTFASNTSVTDAAKLTPADNAAKICRNIYRSIVPPALRGLSDHVDPHQFPASYVRDYAFVNYQYNLLLGIGSAAGIVAVGLFAVQLRRRPSLPPPPPSPAPGRAVAPTSFWLALTVTVALLGTAVHGSESYFGLAHITAQPLLLAGLALVAANFDRLPRPVRYFVVAGAAFDLIFGVLLQLYVQSLVPEPWTVATGRTGGTPLMNAIALQAYADKRTLDLSFLSDAVAPASTAVLIGAASLGTMAVLYLAHRARVLPAPSPSARLRPLGSR